MRVERQAGFTLLEVVVSFAIAALAIGVLYQGVGGGLQATATAARTSEALSLARSHLAALGRGQAVLVQDTSGPEGAGFTWHLRVRPLGTRQIALTESDQATDTRPTSAVLYEAIVTETWEEAGHPHSVVLTTRLVDTKVTQ